MTEFETQLAEMDIRAAQRTNVLRTDEEANQARSRADAAAARVAAMIAGLTDEQLLESAELLQDAQQPHERLVLAMMFEEFERREGVDQ